MMWCVVEPKQSTSRCLGLKLTAKQASRLWHLDAAASATLLDSMVDAGVLYRAKDGGYVLFSAR